ncbi:hypothetical protein OG474_43480 [Kribbella sp. NBC_01505]|uniref:VC0807 family protein n=1 Tax=Kribbella sp. NBC_01505 TaxID=2903580 RepID=UPI00386DBFEE
MSGLWRTVLSVIGNVGLPVGSYALLRVLGANDIWALTGSAAIAAVVLLVQWVRTRQVSALGSLVLLRFVLSFVLAFVIDDARWLLAKDALITAGIGFAAMATLALRRSLIERIRRDLSGDPERFERRIDESPSFRRVHRRLTAVWGVCLVTEAAFELVLVLTLPVPAAFAITNVIGPIVILSLIAITELRTRQTAQGVS